MLTLTADHHHGDGEDLLAVRVGGDVSEADAGEAGHGEVQRCDVDRVFTGTALPSSRTRGVEPVRPPRHLPEKKQPAVCPHAVPLLVDHLRGTEGLGGFEQVLARFSQS